MEQQTTAAFEKLAQGVYLEGLSYDFARDVIWYSDVIAGGIHGVMPDGTPVATLNPSRMWTGGVMMNADGSVLSTGQGGIMWNNPDTGQSGWLIESIAGQPINGVNEMWPDGTGGIFFGTIDVENIIEGKDARATKLYRLTQDRQTIELVEEIGFTNGIAFDADRRCFYCNDTFHRTWVWDVADDLTLFNQRPLLEKEDCDGMALDTDGNVWITGFRSQFLERIAPDGTRLEPIATPAGSVTQVRFGGADRRDMYLTVVPAEGGDTLKEGGALTQTNSSLYRGRSALPGIAIAPAKFDLG